jgi:hypothetical protein
VVLAFPAVEKLGSQNRAPRSLSQTTLPIQPTVLRIFEIKKQNPRFYEEASNTECVEH